MNIIGICFKTNFSQLFSSFSTSRSMSTYPSTFSLRKRTTVSTWLDCSRWMSKPRKISPFVLGNKSTAFLTSKLPFSRPRTFSETGRCACPYLYNTAAHIFQSPRHFALREYVRKSVVYHPLDSTAGSCTDTNPCLGIHTGKEAHILLFADSHASQKSYDSSWPRMEYQKQR